MVEQITWWRFDNAVDSKTCNKIIKLADKEWQKASTKGKEGQKIERQIFLGQASNGYLI